MFRTLRATPPVMLLLFGAVLFRSPSLQAQQPQATAPEPVAASAPAAVTPPAPQPSPLFEANATEVPTIAAAQRADVESRSSGRHSFTMSTLTLILVIVILVLLID
jgi:hypothetical protein